jgi:hypothetical protein
MEHCEHTYESSKIKHHSYFCNNTLHAFIKALIVSNVSILKLIFPFLSFNLCQLDGEDIEKIMQKCKTFPRNILPISSGYYTDCVSVAAKETSFIKVCSFYSLCITFHFDEGVLFLLEKKLKFSVDDIFLALYNFNTPILKLLISKNAKGFLNTYFKKNEKDIGCPLSYLMKIYRRHEIVWYVNGKGTKLIYDLCKQFNPNFNIFIDKSNNISLLSFIVKKDKADAKCIKKILSLKNIDCNILDWTQKRPLDYTMHINEIQVHKIMALILHGASVYEKKFNSVIRIKSCCKFRRF